MPAITQEQENVVALDAYGDPIPAGASLRLGSTRFRRHTSPCLATLLPDNETLLTVGKQLTYYSLKTGQAIRKTALPISDLSIRDAVVTPDHRSAAILGFSFDEENAKYSYVVAVIDTLTGRLKFSSSSDESLGAGIAISNDGLSLAVSGRATRIWDVVSGQEVLSYTIDGVSDSSPIEFDATGHTLYLAHRNTLVKWNWMDGATPTSYALGPPQQRVSPHSLAVSDSGDEVFIGTDEAILRFDLNAQRVTSSLRIDPEQPLGYITDLEFTPDRRHLCSVGHRNSAIAVVMWEVSSGKPVKQFSDAADSFRKLSISLDGMSIVVASKWNNLLDVYKVDSGKRATERYPNHRRSINFLAFGRDQKLISASDDRSLRVWNLQTGVMEKMVEHAASDNGSSHWIRGAAISPDGKYFATSSLDNTVKVWDAVSGKEVYELAGHGALGGQRCLSFSLDSKLLHSFGDDKRLYTYDLSNGKALADKKLDFPELANGGDPFGIGQALPGPCSFSNDGSILILNAGNVLFVDVKSGQVSNRYKPSQRTVFSKPPAVSLDNQLMLTGTLGPPQETALADGRVRYSAGDNHIIDLFRVSDGTKLVTTQFKNSYPGPALFSNDQQFLVVASKSKQGSDGTLRILRSNNLAVVRTINIPGSWATRLAISRDGTQLAAALHDTTILVWDLDSL